MLAIAVRPAPHVGLVSLAFLWPAVGLEGQDRPPTRVESTRPELGPDAWGVSAAPVVSIGQLEGADEYVLYGVRDALILRDGRIAVSNAGTSEVRVFDGSGRWLDSFGGRGTGPGEFNEFSSMRLVELVGDSLGVTDRFNGRIQLFGREGRPGRQVRLLSSEEAPVSPLLGLSDGGWLVVRPVGDLRGGSAEVWSPTLEYQVRSADLTETLAAIRLAARPRVHIEGDTSNRRIPLPLVPEPQVTASGSDLFYVDPLAPQVTVVGPQGERALWRWSPERRRTADIWDKYRGDALSRIAEPSRRAMMARFLEQDLPLREFLPAAQGILIDATGHVWVERYRLPWERTNRWDVLSPEGRWLTIVRVPEGVRVLRIGEDYLLGVDEDELGVERVVRHMIIRR